MFWIAAQGRNDNVYRDRHPDWIPAQGRNDNVYRDRHPDWIAAQGRNDKKKEIKVYKVFCVRFFLLFLFIPAVFAQDLFQESYSFPSIEEEREYADPTILRNRRVMLDRFHLLRSAANNKPVNLNLFRDVELKATLKKSHPSTSGSVFMSGPLEYGGHITLFISNKGIVRGEVHSPTGVYTIRTSKGQRGSQDVTIRQIDTSQLPPIDDGAMSLDRLDSPEKSSSDFSVYTNGVHGKSFSGAFYSAALSATDEETEEAPNPDETVDVLVVYTPNAETSEGGKAEIEATIEAEIEKTNQAFENSGLSQRKIKLVAMEKVEYTQADDNMTDNLQVLRDKKGDYYDPDGILDEVHTLRERYGADLVHLFVEQAKGSCGIAADYNLHKKKFVENFCADDPNPDECIVQKRREIWRHSGYGVLSIIPGCRTQYSFTHELGHNFGLWHDRYLKIKYNGLSLIDPVKFPITPYGFGYVNQNFSRLRCARTIMSYGTQCIDEGHTSSERMLQLMFSNPDMELGSEEVGFDPAGVAGEEWTVALDGPVNASKAIDDVWEIVANLYHSSTSCSNMLFSSLPETINIATRGETKKYTISNSTDYCSDEDLNLTVESSKAFITTSVTAKTVTDEAGEENYAYDVTVRMGANTSCNDRTGELTFSGDGVSKTFSVVQGGAKLCHLVRDLSSAGTVLDSVTFLDFSGQNIDHISGHLFRALTSLESLNLSHNIIRTLYANAFTRSTDLGDLDDELNKKEQIHLIDQGMSITGLVNLKDLDLSNNLISRLSALAFSKLFKLEKLNLSNNQIRSLPATLFSDLVELEDLNLNNNEIGSLPATVFNNLSELETLDVSHNKIRSLAATVFSNLSQLEELNISHNQIRSLSASLFNNLSALKELGISDNQIASLPTDVFSSLTNLEYLWLHNNNLTSVTANAFANLTNLKGLALDGNEVAALSATAFANLTSLKYLWLSVDTVTSMSATLFSNPTSLKYLNLSANGVTNLSATLFSQLTSLKYLSLSVDAVTSLPATLFSHLTGLKYLRLFGDGITSLPAQVCTFINSVEYVAVSGFELGTVCPASATGSIAHFVQRIIDQGSHWISAPTGTMTGNPGVTGAGGGFSSHNENVIKRMYEDDLNFSAISELTGYDENVVSQIITDEFPLPQKRNIQD